MVNVSGEVQLNQLNDQETAKVYEFKAANENKLSFTFNAPPQIPNSTNVRVVWTGEAGLNLINDLIKSLLQTA